MSATLKTPTHPLKGSTMRKSALLASVAMIGMFGLVPAGPVAAFDNTLTGLVPDIYAALDIVSREMIGFVPSVSRNTGAERAAVGEPVKWPVSRAAVASDITPAMQPPTPAARTVDLKSITITKARKANFAYTGEEQKGVNNGPGWQSLQAQEIAQAFRVLANEVEQDIATVAIANASRAYGTPGTTPFATSLTDAAWMKKILDDNGAPGDRSLIINSLTGVNVRSLTQLTKVNEAGTSMTLRDGQLLDIFGLSMKETAATMADTKGTAAGSTTNTAGYAIGATTITLASAGTGTLTAGDVITFAGDTNKYVVVTGDADVSNGGTVVIQAPGLLVAIPTAATAITVGNSYTASVAFSRNALALAARPPAIPDDGDLAVDSMLITDIRSGITFDVRKYKGYHMNEYEIGLAWGVAAPKPEHIGLLLG
jgi:hypothetical protein